MNILEAYQKKLSISEKVYSKEHGGRAMPQTKKIAVARVLANTSEYLNEAFSNSVGTQLANMKTFKKFCLDLTTVALPNLIANDLVMVWPLKSRTGYIQYLSFTAGSNKGGVNQGDLFNDPFRLGKMDDNRVNYTASLVVDVVTTAGQFTAAWTPVVKGFKTILINPADPTSIVEYQENFIDKYTAAQLATVTYYTYKLIATDGTITYVNVIPGDVAVGTKVAYKYDNVVIPQNDLPIVNAHMEGISLEAKARRIAVYYSQMAQFQAKTEMGIDLGEVLATQACGELSYEIDTEVVDTLVNGARFHEDLVWNKARPVGVSIRDHYAAFAETIALASKHIYDETQKYEANYILASSALKPIFGLMEDWKPVSNAKVNGPYYAGELLGMKVYISPRMGEGEFVVGYNGDDMVTSAAVFAPYMAIIPTQLLGFSDGSMSQGFSTLYDLKLLNPLLIVKGKVINVPEPLVITGDGE